MKKHSEETKRRMSEARRKWWEKKKNKSLLSSCWKVTKMIVGTMPIILHSLIRRS